MYTSIIQVPALIVQPHRIDVFRFSVGWIGDSKFLHSSSGACVSTCNDEGGRCIFGLSAKPIQHCVFPLDLSHMVLFVYFLFLIELTGITYLPCDIPILRMRLRIKLIVSLHLRVLAVEPYHR